MHDNHRGTMLIQIIPSYCAIYFHMVLGLLVYKCEHAYLSCTQPCDELATLKENA